MATLDVLQGLVPFGFECQAFCTSKLDFREEVPLERFIADLHDPYHVEPSVCGAERAQVLYTRRNRVPITVVRLASSRHTEQRREEVGTVLAFFRKFLDSFAPDCMVTYGGDPITQGMIRLAKGRGIPVVFMIHNFAYTKAQGFANVDYCVVASEFARGHYERKVGLACRVLPYPVDWERVVVREGRRGDRAFVTFVNPSLEKGVYAFARIADELGRRRPDIPLLIVESRGNRQTLGACGLDLAVHGNLHVMPHTTDPRRFWSVTKIALLPSLWWENQPLVAIEAMINGIPVIGSDRGGIPETLGQSGFVLPLPERLTPTSNVLPAADEVEPWVETIIRLWDDQELYREQSAKARAEAERWRPERVLPLYARFFRDVRPQNEPPFVSGAQSEDTAVVGAGLPGSGFETTRQDIGVVRFSSPDGCRPVTVLKAGDGDAMTAPAPGGRGSARRSSPKSVPASICRSIEDSGSHGGSPSQTVDECGSHGGSPSRVVQSRASGSRGGSPSQDADECGSHGGSPSQDADECGSHGGSPSRNVTNQTIRLPVTPTGLQLERAGRQSPRLIYGFTRPTDDFRRSPSPRRATTIPNSKGPLP